MRVVLDTNIFVSSFLSPAGPPAQIVAFLRHGRFEVAVSEDILSEYREILNEDPIRERHGYTPEQLDAILVDLRGVATVIPAERLQHIGAVAADPDDNKFIECAVAAGADFIVSGDKHLLSLKVYSGVQILSPAAFLLAVSAE